MEVAVHRVWPTLLPELRRFPESEQGPALERARETPLDLVEIAGTVVALVAVTAVTKYTLPDLSLISRLGMALLNFGVALPLLVATIGPFHVRRLRRGLRKQLESRPRQ
jgi:hypothetical protein